MNLRDHHNPNITPDDLAVVREVRKLLPAVLAIPVGPLEHAAQVAHETYIDLDSDPEFDPEYAEPPEYFEAQGVTREALRLFFAFRCNLELAMSTATSTSMPREARR